MGLKRLELMFGLRFDNPGGSVKLSAVLDDWQDPTPLNK
jgi:hypothetical protein